MLATLALLGCSTIKFAYNNVDWLLLEQADDYLDLNDSQHKHAEQLVAARMRAHRRDELPEYVTTLKQVRVMLSDNLTADEVVAIKQQMEVLYRRTMSATCSAFREPVKNSTMRVLRSTRRSSRTCRDDGMKSLSNS